MIKFNTCNNYNKKNSEGNARTIIPSLVYALGYKLRKISEKKKKTFQKKK